MTDRAVALAGLAALAVMIGAWPALNGGDAVLAVDASGSARTGRQEADGGSADAATRREWLVGGYGGVTNTQPSTVEITNPGRTDMTVKDFGWEGRPFKSPIYYGLRAITWNPDQRFGAMLDFTHAKAIARFEDVATFTGTLNGKPLPAKAKVAEVFKHLEFSHGHNMVMANGLASLGTFASAIRPYVGVGGGVSLPHTEIGFRAEEGRTYEYQYAGLTGQVLAGVEVRLGRASVFFEYKLTYSPYEVPLSGVVNGWLLVTDLWRQLRAWAAGEKPPGGTLRTTLVTHHGIAGALVRVSGQSRP